MNLKGYKVLLDNISNSYRINDFFQKKINNVYLRKSLTFLYSFTVGNIFLFINSIRNSVYTKNHKYDLSIVAICKNEGNYIEEWIAFHKICGISHIYLYNNGSTDNTILKVEKYSKEGYVSIINWPGSKMQINSYNHALQNYGKENKYLVFIDCDEFIFPSDTSKNIIRIIDAKFKRNKFAGGIGINWVVYGSSGHVTKPTGLVVENFIKRGDLINGKGNECIKSLVRPSRVKKYINPHYPKYRFGYFAINMVGDFISKWSTKPSPLSEIRINHYFTKSLQEWQERRKIGKADHINEFRTLQEFYDHNDNTYEDKIACDYLNELKKELEER